MWQPQEFSDNFFIVLGIGPSIFQFYKMFKEYLNILCIIAVEFSYVRWNKESLQQKAFHVYHLI